ncbi:hypothetical protein LEL_07271 [Akanthomyces lecanii RCEF 1005]|uniref:Uncharacterized protein n=1 Tax=Akanthomyces lecanii RCEF 1005 TaxID=1081108 RepID=A0A168FJT7_CORDF|nr:hypothetical protein LEL_07271 [Akanthomyces lecanii RCEF 1005]
MCSDFVVVDRRGDLRLEVGREPGTRDDSWQRAEFLVCSRTLARASPVFDRMLHGPFVEAKHDPKDSAGWRVVLPDNNPAPMEVFLNIAHANVARIPHILSVDHLYDLAVLTNYYDATPLLSPWIDVWISSTSEISRDANMIQPKLLWISWEFGRTDTFRIVAHRLLMEEPSPARSIHEGDEVQAPHILEYIDSIRIQAIQKLLHVVRDVTDRLTVADEGPRWCRHARQVRHHQCESMALGSITFCLARAGLWPLPAAAEVKLSLSDLDRVLASMVIHDIGETTDEPRVDHGVCNPRQLLMKQVEQVMRGVPSPVADFHVKHLEEQAVRLRHGSAK